MRSFINFYESHSPNTENIKISILEDGSNKKIGEAQVLLEKSDFFTKIGARIWHSYRCTRMGDYRIRSGASHYGCYTPDENLKTYREESLSEHMLGAMTLFRMVTAEYLLLDSNMILRGLDFLRYHDLGEVEFGDIPDNGERDKELCDKREYISLCQKTALLDTNLRLLILYDFNLFNKKEHGLKNEKEKLLFSLLKMSDKTDAILRGLIYEQNGYIGRLNKMRVREASPSEIRYAKVMGDDSLVAVFTANFIDHYHDSIAFPIFFDIIKAAVMQTRGYWWKSFDQILKGLKVDQEIMTKSPLVFLS